MPLPWYGRSNIHLSLIPIHASYHRWTCIHLFRLLQILFAFMWKAFWFHPRQYQCEKLLWGIEPISLVIRHVRLGNGWKNTWCITLNFIFAKRWPIIIGPFRALKNVFVLTYSHLRQNGLRIPFLFSWTIYNFFRFNFTAVWYQRYEISLHNLSWLSDITTRSVFRFNLIYQGRVTQRSVAKQGH